MATVLIMGATRGIGLKAVERALEAGHSVRALARSARRIPFDHPKLTKVPADALDEASVERALEGVDAIIQTLGVTPSLERALRPTNLFSKATRGSHPGDGENPGQAADHRDRIRRRR